MSERHTIQSGHSNKFDWPLRVYYEDTDAGGIVYHANYLRFMERARTEWLRRLGFEQDRLRQELRLLFAVRSLEIDYRKPALFNDELTVVTQLQQLRHASLTFSQRIVNCKTPATLLVQASVKVACIDADSRRPVALPAAIKMGFEMEIEDVG